MSLQLIFSMIYLENNIVAEFILRELFSKAPDYKTMQLATYSSIFSFSSTTRLLQNFKIHANISANSLFIFVKKYIFFK